MIAFLLMLRFPIMFRFAPQVAALALSLALCQPAGAAEAALRQNPFCASVPRLEWLSTMEVQSHLEGRGYRLVRLRMADDKCYGALVRDGDGALRDLVMHPVTAEIIRDSKR